MCRRIQTVKKQLAGEGLAETSAHDQSSQDGTLSLAGHKLRGKDMTQVTVSLIHVMPES